MLILQYLTHLRKQRNTGQSGHMSAGDFSLRCLGEEAQEHHSSLLTAGYPGSFERVTAVVVFNLQAK